MPPSLPPSPCGAPPLDRLLVISPHLDDAVFGCGSLISAATQATVATVFAGVPAAGIEAPDWDRRAGFDTAAAAMQARRREDHTALSQLGAQPLWLDFLDCQYGQPAPPGALLEQMKAIVVRQRPGSTIAAPLGLFHSDHVLVQRAALQLWRAAPAAHRWLFYEDALYRRVDDLLQQRLAGWYQDGIHATPVDFTATAEPAHHTAKMAAIDAYQSQLQLFNAQRIADLASAERYWQLQLGDNRPATNQ